MAAEAGTRVRQKLLNISGSRRNAPTQVRARSTDWKTYESCITMCVAIVHPQKPHARRTPSDAVQGTINRIPMISSPVTINLS
jgi:hypothetical protein